MTPPRIVVYAIDRAFRVQCATTLRGAGAHARLASNQAELAKAMGDGLSTVIIVGDDRSDAEGASALAAALAPLWLIMQRAPGESIEEIVARALGVPEARTDQPRSSE